jgi:hypothetical protein
MKKILFSSMLIVSCLAFGQKVKFKNDIVFIDNVETFHYEKAGENLIIYTLKDKDFISIVYNFYEEKNPARFNGNDPNAFRYPAYIKKRISTVKFLKIEKEMNTSMSDKDLMIKLSKSDLIDENGNLKEDNVDIFINKYSNEKLEYKLLK